ncbi:MAG: exosome complex RNA-binding protein Csl4 [Candidatus Hadarchaeales archaeon]
MVEVKTGDFVVPGDLLGTAEEFVPGEGAYEEGGKVYSCSTGVVLLDSRKKHVSVFPRVRGPPVLKRGDVVIGVVEDVREQSANVNIAVLRGREDRELPIPSYGTIHISQVSSSYVRDLGRQFRPGDIVRAKVVNAEREPVQLTTAGEDLGVIFSRCSRCRGVLEFDGRKLKCPNCGRVEIRKTAGDYRGGSL